ncbi:MULTISPECIES: hypothetical protein [unclassified Paraburkholderia]|uniref:hypothetical protein n=1 Tax=unclassified Paraburkholderia TaxID=2615204 RepID=UPI002AB1D939|nr:MULTISPECIES: hypothetical protein [unclassified Paraburkholderia]
MNVKSIYASPSTFDRAVAAFSSAMRAFSNGMWIPFAASWLIGIVILFVGIAKETQGWAELFQIGGQAALDGYFATVHAAHMNVLHLMSDALLGHSILIGGVLQGWGMVIAFAIVPLALILSFAGATISASIEYGRGNHRH